MRHYLLLLSSAVLLSIALPSFAQIPDRSAVKLYQSDVSAAKRQVQPLEEDFQYFDEKEALKISQAAIGNQVGDYTFLDRSGRKVRLSDYRGKPLVISMIYTNCPFVCATITRNLLALKNSQEALGADSFKVLTVGFDAENDTPTTMGYFAERNDVNLPNWDFVSADAATIKKLSKDLGFIFFPSEEGGYNHIAQTTFVDAKGKVYIQIYGEEFENITLLQPLKDMIYNVQSVKPGIEGISNRIRLYCTVYDRRTGEFRVNYSYFYGIGMGVFSSLLILWWLIHEYRRSPKRHRRSDD